MHFTPGRKDLVQVKPRIVLNKANVAWGSLLVNNLKNLKVALQKKRKRERTVERWYLGTTSAGNKEIFSSTEDTLQAPKQGGHMAICSLTEHMSTGSCWDRWEKRLLDFASSFVRTSHFNIPVLVLCSSFPLHRKAAGKEPVPFLQGRNSKHFK